MKRTAQIGLLLSLLSGCMSSEKEYPVCHKTCSYRPTPLPELHTPSHSITPTKRLPDIVAPGGASGLADNHQPTKIITRLDVAFGGSEASEPPVPDWPEERPAGGGKEGLHSAKKIPSTTKDKGALAGSNPSLYAIYCKTAPEAATHQTSNAPLAVHEAKGEQTDSDGFNSAQSGQPALNHFIKTQSYEASVNSITPKESSAADDLATDQAVPACNESSSENANVDDSNFGHKKQTANRVSRGDLRHSRHNPGRSTTDAILDESQPISADPNLSSALSPISKTGNAKFLDESNNNESSNEMTSTVAAQPLSGTQLINSKRIRLNFAVKTGTGASKEMVELYFTRDSRHWQKYVCQSRNRPPFVADMPEEGVYGFTMISHGEGEASIAPREGEEPQVWVEVDLTKPDVHLLQVEPGSNSEGRTLSIQWKATDKNLGAESINLSYAAQAAGPWSPIASKIENTGRFLWQLPATVPAKVFIRVEATDMAGNTSHTDTSSQVQCESAKASISILDLQPVDGN